MIESSLIHDGFMVTGHKAVQFEETDEIRGGLQASWSRCVKIVWYVWFYRQNSWGQDAPWADRRRYPWTIGSGWSYTIIWWKGCSLASWFSIVLHLSEICQIGFAFLNSVLPHPLAEPVWLLPIHGAYDQLNSWELIRTPGFSEPPPSHHTAMVWDGMRWYGYGLNLGPKGISNLM